MDGRRNVYVAEAPAWEARPVTRYSADDGQELSGLVWSPDARAVLYARGSDRNAAGEVPNPSSSPRGAQQEVWLAPLGPGAPRRLAEGTAPVPSPTGERVAYLLRDTAWVAPLGGPGQPKILFRARGATSGLAWSPDGVRVAFVSDRGDHAFIGVYDADRDTVLYLAPSVDRDALPRWSPDGRQVAFVRQFGGVSGPVPGGASVLRRGRSGWPTPSRGRGTKCGTPRRLPTAPLRVPLASGDCCGAPTTGWCSRARWGDSSGSTR